MSAALLIAATPSGAWGQTTNPNAIEFAPSPDHDRLVPGATTSVLTVSEMTWISEVNGWGPAERNRSNGEMGAGDGQTMTLNGATYASGVGVHAGSELRLGIPTGCTTFSSDVGIDDEVGSRGSGTFEVVADGVALFTTGVMTGDTGTRRANVDVTGRSELRLIMRDGGDGPDFDHGDWANAALACLNTQPAVTDYSLAFYLEGALEPFSMVAIGKPSPQADGMARGDLTSFFVGWPVPGMNAVARVIAHGPGGPGVSLASNVFQYGTTSPTATPAPAPNAPPSVQILRPTSGSVVRLRKSRIDAAATDSDGAVSSISIYVNGVLLGTAAGGSASMRWSPDAGSYSLTAIAVDDAGARSQSPVVTVVVR